MLVTRQFVCERLKLSPRQSRVIFPPELGGRIFERTVLDVLRNKAVNIPKPPAMIPSDLLTPDELAQELNADREWVLRLIRNERKTPPHYRLNVHTILIPRAIFLTWAATAKDIRRRRSA